VRGSDDCGVTVKVSRGCMLAVGGAGADDGREAVMRWWKLGAVMQVRGRGEVVRVVSFVLR